MDAAVMRISGSKLRRVGGHCCDLFYRSAMENGGGRMGALNITLLPIADIPQFGSLKGNKVERTGIPIAVYPYR